MTDALKLTVEQLARLTGGEYDDFPPDDEDLYDDDDWWIDSYDCGCCMCCGCSCDSE